MLDARMPAAFPKTASLPEAVLPSRESLRVLTISEVAHELRCSKAHVSNIISGKVHNLPPLPVLRIGRRVLIRHDGLRAWLMSVEAREVEAQRLTGFFR